MCHTRNWQLNANWIFSSFIFCFSNPRMAYSNTKVDSKYEEKEPLWSRWFLLYGDDNDGDEQETNNNNNDSTVHTPQQSRGKKRARLSLFTYNKWWANREKKTDEKPMNEVKRYQ